MERKWFICGVVVGVACSWLSCSCKHSATSLDRLPGSLERSEDSPKGDIRVEYRRDLQNKDDPLYPSGSAWLVPKNDEAKRRLFYRYLRGIDVKFSPDEKWIVVNDYKGSGDCGVQLFRRTQPDDVLYEVPVELDFYSTSIGELAWCFFSKQLWGKTVSCDFKPIHVEIVAMAWQADSSAVLLKISRSGSDSGYPVSTPYECWYHVGDQHFESITNIDVLKHEIEQAQAQQSPPASAEAPAPSTPSVKLSVAATKENPWENSLGMKFVPVLGTKVLFSIWDTRVQDYAAFVSSTGRAWAKPFFPQDPNHPAVNVSWDDAIAFCAWLTDTERNQGAIGTGQQYRLPTDEEWSVAVGLPHESGNTPKEKHKKIKGLYPWGKQWPPPKGSGNYTSSLNVDPYQNTSPVGSFKPNRYGLFDMGGNVWQWCEDWYDAEQKYRVLRGACYAYGADRLLSSFREMGTPSYQHVFNGFRCVLADIESEHAKSSTSATIDFTPPKLRIESQTNPTPSPQPSKKLFAGTWQGTIIVSAPNKRDAIGNAVSDSEERVEMTIDQSEKKITFRTWYRNWKGEFEEMEDEDRINAVERGEKWPESISIKDRTLLYRSKNWSASLTVPDDKGTAIYKYDDGNNQATGILQLVAEVKPEAATDLGTVRLPEKPQPTPVAETSPSYQTTPAALVTPPLLAPPGDNNVIPTSFSDFFGRVWGHQRTNDPSEWASDFASQVAYCYKDNGFASRSWVQQDRAKLIERYPARDYQMVGNPSFNRSSDLEIKAEYRYRYNYYGKKHASGQAYVMFTATLENGEWRISKFNEVTNRD